MTVDHVPIRPAVVNGLPGGTFDDDQGRPAVLGEVRIGRDPLIHLGLAGHPLVVGIERARELAQLLTFFADHGRLPS